MNLGELLSELRLNVLHDRSSQIAGPSDLLWSDETLCRYIDEAQRRFARKALVIRDGTSTPLTKVTLVANQNMYPLDKTVLGVISAILTGDKADLARAGHGAFQTYRQPDPYFFDPSQLSALPPGKPLAWGTDEYMTADINGSWGETTFRVYPVPSATYAGQVINLRVVRMPLTRLTLANLTAVPEVPEEHHMEMLDWAAYLALRIVDLDAGNPQRAAEFAASFEANVALARQNSLRKMFTPMQWGFGRNAFSWES